LNWGIKIRDWHAEDADFGDLCGFFLFVSFNHNGVHNGHDGLFVGMPSAITANMRQILYGGILVLMMFRYS